MRAHVLNDGTLVKRAGQFAWLSIDTENPVNAAFTAKFPTEGVPTFLVIDPSSEKVTLSWYGTATVAQFGMLMDDALRAADAGGSGADVALARGDEANARKDFAGAAEYYHEALNIGGKDWKKRARTIESLVMAYSFARNQKACTETALEDAPSMARDRSFVNVVYFGLDCATPGTPEAHEIEKLAEVAVKTPGAFSDDISQLYGSLAFYYRQEKNETDALRVTNARIQYLELQRARTKSPDARLALDFQYVSAANFLSKPELPVANLERDERELPNDYNPPYLLAIQLNEMKRYDEALAACDRALHLAYGGGKLRAYALKGQILERKGDKAGAKKTYGEGLAFAKTLPPDTAKVARQRIEAALARF
jgi:tetratricopeptide (TPR) repeat protein